MTQHQAEAAMKKASLSTVEGIERISEPVDEMSG
jgi:hypothetical protein